MKVSRRQFLKGGLATAACACCSAAWGPLGPRAVFAQSNGGTGRMAIFINQFGGNDPLNSFAIPFTRSAYYDRRPTIAIPDTDVLPLGGGIGFNPVLSNLYSLYQAGDVAVVQGTGDPVGTRSHFTSQEIFSRGSTDDSGVSDRRGWIGRMGDLYFNNVAFNTFGIGVGQQTDFNADRSTNRPIVASSISSVGYINDYTGSSDNNFRRRIMEENVTRTKLVGPRATAVRQSQNQTLESRQALQNVINSYSGVTTYPGDSLGNYLREAAMLLEYGLGTKVAYGGIGGWDNHSGQRGSQDGRLATIDAAVAAFAQDAQQMGKWDDVCIVIFSEFGRKTFENGSNGTDHGWGGAMVAIGGAVNGAVYGGTPTNGDLNNRDWLYQDVDFRNVFSRVISWLGYNPGPVFPEPYDVVSTPVI